MDIRKPRVQQIWRFPAVINFTLGSMGAGFYVWASLDSFLAVGVDAPEGNGSAGIVAIILIFTGFFALLFEAGNPLKSYLTLLNPRHSWMSRELWLALLFAGLIGFDFVYPGLGLVWGAALIAFLFILSQAFIVFRARAILAWNVWPIVPLFTLTGLSSGFGLYVALNWHTGMAPTLPLLGGASWMLCLITVLYYVFGFGNQDVDFRNATHSLRTPVALFMGVVFGLFAPLGILAAVTMGVMETYDSSAMILAGIGVVIGAWQRNGNIVMKAGYFRRIGISARVGASH